MSQTPQERARHRSATEPGCRPCADRRVAISGARARVVEAVDEWRKAEESDAPGFVVGQKLCVIRTRAKALAKLEQA